MQTVTANFLAAVKGSTKPTFYADLWKNNTFIKTLPIEAGSCSVSFDQDSDVQASGKIVVLDNDGTLTPTSMGSALTPFGAAINIRAGFKLPSAVEENVSLGWFLINDMEIEEAWQTYVKEGITTYARNGSRITLNLVDFMQKVIDYKFLVPTSPTQQTAWAEIVYLVQDIMSTQTPSYSGYADLTIPSTLTYGEDRMEAVKALAAVLAAEPVMLPNGKLSLKPINPAQSAGNTAPTFGWNINVSEYKKRLSREDVFNIVVARGKTEDNVGLVGYAIKGDGPTSFYGSTGPRPVFYDTDFLTTAASLKAYAEAQLATLAQRNSQVVPIRALPNPAIELGDYATLNMQSATTSSVTARVVGFTYHDRGEMDITLSMPANWVG